MVGKEGNVRRIAGLVLLVALVMGCEKKSEKSPYPTADTATTVPEQISPDTTLTQ